MLWCTVRKTSYDETETFKQSNLSLNTERYADIAAHHYTNLSAVRYADIAARHYTNLSAVRYADIAARHYTNTALQAANRLIGWQADWPPGPQDHQTLRFLSLAYGIKNVTSVRTVQVLNSDKLKHWSRHL